MRKWRTTESEPIDVGDYYVPDPVQPDDRHGWRLVSVNAVPIRDWHTIFVFFWEFEEPKSPRENQKNDMV